MNRIQNLLDPASQLAQLVQSAAHSAACPAAVFYLCERDQYEIAACYGCYVEDAQASRDFALLNQAEQNADPLMIIPEIRGAFAPSERHWLFGEAAPTRFAATVQVAFEHKSACGLLLVADTVPHWLNDQQQQMLRAHAAQITLLLEYENLRRMLPEQNGGNELTPSGEPAKAWNRRLTGSFFRRARRAEAENSMLEEEKTALEAEIQERKRIAARLHHVAFHDDMTALHNRQFFMDRLSADMQLLISDPNYRFAVLLVDLDGFKSVNDSFGHRTGDLLLIEVAQRLRSCVRGSDLVARIGGDEFAVLVEGFEEISLVATMAARLVEVMRYPVQLLGQEVFPAASIGAAHATRYYREPEELLRDADLAMYEAKRQRLGFLIFDDSLYRSAMVSTQLRTELRRALARSEFYIEYQPIISLATREIRGVEALIRWQHPTRGPLQPVAFIAAAEELGLIKQIGNWILREACTQMREWNDQYPALGLRVSVNVSAHQLTDGRFLAQLDEILASTGLDPTALLLEVTESIFLPDSAPIADIIRDVRSRGVRVTLDDFGTGYSSLSYLDRYPIDAIKIDQSFVAGIPARRRTISIIKAIIELARALNLEIIAEGIENESQQKALLSMGCELAQGFALSHPLAPPAVAKLLHKQSLPPAFKKPKGIAGRPGENKL